MKNRKPNPAPLTERQLNLCRQARGGRNWPAILREIDEDNALDFAFASRAL